MDHTSFASDSLTSQNTLWSVVEGPFARRGIRECEEVRLDLNDRVRAGDSSVPPDAGFEKDTAIA